MQDKIKQKKAQHEWYLRNKELTYSRYRKRVEERKEWFKNYLTTCSCSKCGENEPCCLEFHHLDSSEKDKAISDMIHNGTNVEKILMEIDKCVCLCANCHRIEHYKPLNILSGHNQTTRVWFQEFKNGLVCEQCGASNIAFLDLHHTNPDEKEDKINNLIRRNFSVERLLIEINKCSCLCANCHKRYHKSNKCGAVRI